VARIKHRKRADGGVSLQVCWVLGGGRASAGAREQAETFTDLNRAQAFKLDVEHSGHEWPDGWVKGEGMSFATVPSQLDRRWVMLSSWFGPHLPAECSGGGWRRAMAAAMAGLGTAPAAADDSRN
jgi:hypothetical protein